jgi:hypothetical protein
MDVRLLGGCQGACEGIYAFRAATVLCGLECFSWCFVCYLVFTVVSVIGCLSMISWSRGLGSSAFCSGIRCPFWW